MSPPVHRPRGAPLPAVASSERILGAVVGKVAGFEGGEARVLYPGSGPIPLPARSLVAYDDTVLKEAARTGAEAVLLFEDGDPARPLLVGLLRSRTPLLDALLVGPLPQRERVARVDGRRVLIEGQEEVSLKCGEASLTLRRDGVAILKGVNVITQAKRVTKVRGGKVQIN